MYPYPGLPKQAADAAMSDLRTVVSPADSGSVLLVVKHHPPPRATCHQSPQIGGQQLNWPVRSPLWRTDPLGPPGFGSVRRATPPVWESTLAAANRNGPTDCGNNTVCPDSTWSARRSRRGLIARNLRRNGQIVQAVCPGITARAITPVQTSRPERGGSALAGRAASSSSAWSQIALPASPRQPCGSYAATFAVAPNSPGDGANDILLFGGTPLWRSTNSGVTWEGGTKPYHADHHVFAFIPANPPAGRIPATYIGSDGGLGVSTGLANPSAAFPAGPGATPGAFDELGTYSTTNPAIQNLGHGK